MLYEAMLVKLKRRHAWSEKGSNGVTALEVLSHFASLGISLLSDILFTHIFSYVAFDCLQHCQTKIPLWH